MNESTAKRGGLGRLLLRTFLLIVVPLAVAMVALHLYARGGRFIETENAYVKANVIAITPEVSGRVIWVGAQDNGFAEEGTQLFRIDPEPFRIALEQADAKVSVVLTDIETLRSTYREAIVEEGRQQDTVRFLQLQLERQRKLRDKRMGSEERFDLAEHELALGKRELQSARETTRKTLLELGNDPNFDLTKHGRYREAISERDRAALDLQRTKLQAPASGTVSNMKLQVGEYVEEGDPVFTMIESDPVWVEANLKETQLTHVRIGQTVTVEVDAYPDFMWDASVNTIAPATGAEFALLPPQNATGNWVKVVQRVPVQLSIVRPREAPPLRAGMTVAVSIDTGHKRVLPPMVKNLIDEGGVLQPLDALVGKALAWTKRDTQ
ncbi:MAG: membrane fusion protein (multidrug efflux system) [Gammaproteobacteria bacterium]|jgi:membrane fusion protein (multidrug efflux system)